MLSKEKKLQLKNIAEKMQEGGTLDCGKMTVEELEYYWICVMYLNPNLAKEYFDPKSERQKRLTYRVYSEVLESFVDDKGINALSDTLYTPEENMYMHNYFKSKECEKKEEVMNKYLIMINDDLAKYAKDITEAKLMATDAIEAGYEEVYIYEKKMTASVVKPKVEFKEV